MEYGIVNMLNFIDQYTSQNHDLNDIIFDNNFLSYLVQHKILVQSYEFMELKRTIENPAFFLCFAKTKSKIFRNISALKTITTMLEYNNINYAVVKGSALSFYTYGNIHTRQYSDIDIIVSSKDIVKACTLFLQEGFKEEFIEHLHSNNFSVSSEDLEKHFLSSTEKKFLKKGYPLIEVKVESGLLGADFFNQALRSKARIMDNSVSFYTFNIINTFLYLSWTLFENFYIESSFLGKDYVIRDILDYYFYINKYEEILIKQIELIGDSQKTTYIKYSMSILKDFLSPAKYHSINPILAEYSSQFSIPDWLETVHSPTPFIQNLFNSNYRIGEYYRYMYNSLNVVPEHFSTQYLGDQSWKDGFYSLYGTEYFKSIAKITCDFCLKQDADSIYLLTKVPRVICNFDIDLYMLNSNQTDINLYTSNMKFYIRGNGISYSDTEDFKFAHAELENDEYWTYIKINIPKIEHFRFCFFDNISYYFYFSIELPEVKNKYFLGNLGHFFHPIRIINR